MYLSDCWPWRGLGDDLAYKNTIRAHGVFKRYLPHRVCRTPGLRTCPGGLLGGPLSTRHVLVAARPTAA